MRLVDLDRVLDELRRFEASSILQAGHHGPAGFLARLYERDPSTLIEHSALEAHDPDRRREAQSDQLGVCPGCGETETVVNTRGDVYECIGEVRGCGATWRGARLGTP